MPADPIQPDTLPQGLWAALRRADAAPVTGYGDLWRGLERTVTQPVPEPGAQLWGHLAQDVDPTLFCPQAVPDVAEEQVVEDNQELTVIRSPRGNYLRLTPAQRQIWHQMDGTRTVGQLATQAFLTFKQLLPVGDLVTTLRGEGFLTDAPVGVYRQLADRMEGDTAEGLGKRALRLFTGLKWQATNLDRVYGALYRGGGWLLFTPVFAVLWIAVTLAGLGAFTALWARGDLGAVLRATGAAQLTGELLLLWCALLVSFFLHESAHALAVKHFGRTLGGGGAMLYFGAPAFFVDTSDIWRSPRRARILVSAAGPMSDLFIGGLAAFVLLADPSAWYAGIALKLALTCYIATLFNANPLLELDGYYILVDLLRLPNLRPRALAFVRGELWGRLTGSLKVKGQSLKSGSTDFSLKSQGQSLKSASSDFAAHPSDGVASLRSPTSNFHLSPFNFSREETIFTLYGLGALAYTLVAVWFAVAFWRRFLLGTVGELWLNGGWLGQLVGGAIMLLVVLPLLAALALAGFGLGRSALNWALRRGYGRQPPVLAGLALLLTLGSAAVAAQAPAGVGAVLGVALWGLALGALQTLRQDYAGAAVEPALRALFWSSVLALAAMMARAVGRVILPLLTGVDFGAEEAIAPFWQLLDGLAFVYILVAGVTALLDVNLRYARQLELIGLVLLLMVAFFFGGAALVVVRQQYPTSSFAVQLAIAAPAYFGALALALLLPFLLQLRDSRLALSWGLIWLAVAAQTSAYIFDLWRTAISRSWVTVLDIPVAALWAGAWLAHLATLRQLTVTDRPEQPSPSADELSRLQHAFRLTYTDCYRTLLTVYGSRRAQELDDRMDVYAATANWDVTLDADRVRIGPLASRLPPEAQGARYAEVLRYTVQTLEELTGAAFARRTIRAAYDALPWPERETASRLCFPDTPWAAELSSQFGNARAARLRLLRQTEVFAGCDDDALTELLQHAVEQRFPARSTVLAAGDQPPGVWVLDAGEVLALRAGQPTAELHRGATVGGRELAADVTAQATYATTIASELLFMPASAARAALATQTSGAERDTLQTLRLLERVTLFYDVPRHTLRGLAAVAVRHTFAARTMVVQEGQRSGTFYVIDRGLARVVRRDRAEGETLSKLQVIAQLGPEEFFGELELLRGTPPVASVVAVTELTVVALPHAAISALLLGEQGMARGLEQIGTGRLRALAAG